MTKRASKARVRSRPTSPDRPPSASLSPAFAPPYPPSWFDRLAARLDRLPVSPYLLYAVLGSVILIAFLLVQWREGGTSGWEIRPFHVSFALWIPFMLAMMHYLDHLAAAAFKDFQPALRATPEESRSLQYRIATLPARTAALLGAGLVLANTLLFLVDYLVAGSTGRTSLFEIGPQLIQVAPTTLSLAVSIVLLFGVWWVSATFLYHTAHQLREISRIYSQHTSIRLLHLGPLYTFSRVTQRTTIGILAFFYVFSLTATGFSGQPAFLLLGGLLFAAVAAITFAWPLVGVHRLLVAEKERRLEENTRRLEAGIAELHRRMDRRNLNGMDDLNKALASLDLERSGLTRIPTWPWEPGTLRGLVAALLIPVIIWAIQAGAGRFFS